MNITKITRCATEVASAVKENIKPNKLIGADYSCIDDFVKSDFTKSAIGVAARNGKLTQDMIDQMILERLPKTIKQAELFAQDHPELSKEDVVQDLIEYMVRLANEYKGQINGDYNHHFLVNEKRFLNSLLNDKSEDACGLIEKADIYQIPDDSLDVRIQASNSQDFIDIMDTLTPRQKYILINRFGLDGDKPKTLEKIGEEVHLHKDNVRKDQNKALWKLRLFPRVKIIKDDVNIASSYTNAGDKIIHLIDREMLIK